MIAYQDSTTSAQIASALSYCHQYDDRDYWCSMAMSIKHELGEDGFTLWNRWSEQSNKYKESSAREVWRSVKANGGKTIKSLFSEAIKGGWKNNAAYTPPTLEQRAAIDAQNAANDLRIEAEKEAKQATMRELYTELEPATNDDSYLESKGVSAVNGLKKQGVALIVPMYSFDGVLTGLQTITTSDKKISKGSTKGHFLIGNRDDDIAAICEGLATGLSIHEATGLPVYVAFDSGNLSKIAAQITSKRLLIASDVDLSEAGQKAAIGAANAHKNAVIVSPFDSASDKTDEASDFNDLARIAGNDAVKAKFDEALSNFESLAAVSASLAKLSKAEYFADKAVKSLTPAEQKALTLARGEELLCVAEIVDTLPRVLSSEQMEAALVYIADGSMVSSLAHNWGVMPWRDFVALTAASKTAIKKEDGKIKMVATSSVWLNSPKRETVMTQTFRAGHGGITCDPEGRTALNSWKPYDRTGEAGSVDLFLDQMEYLFPIETEREHFLNWLAHIEQRPDVLPDSGYIHIAKHTGSGRNWLASLLGELWRGKVAPAVDLANLLDSRFNGVLSGKVLAIVDEVQEGGAINWSHAEKLKQMINPKIRLIEKKGQNIYQEFNACRWLMFSNHENAVPLSSTDRRFNIAYHNAQPRPQEDYTALYNALGDPSFIQRVATYLKQRDISGFNASARPAMNEAKRRLIDSGKPETVRLAEDVLKYWPCDLITNKQLAEIEQNRALKDGEGVSRGFSKALIELGAVRREKQVKHEGCPVVVMILKNAERWMQAPPLEVAKELSNLTLNQIPKKLGYQILGDVMTA